jgi:mRNA interferase HigB
MHVTSRKALIDFSGAYADAKASLNLWYIAAKKGTFQHLADLKQTFCGVDYVSVNQTDFYIFNIGGNKYRLIATIHFNRQKLYIRHILTHKEYDQGGWKR